MKDNHIPAPRYNAGQGPTVDEIAAAHIPPPLQNSSQFRPQPHQNSSQFNAHRVEVIKKIQDDWKLEDERDEQYNTDRGYGSGAFNFALTMFLLYEIFQFLKSLPKG